MTYLTGFLPVEQGVACIAALRRAADTARCEGDERSRGQVMADTLVARVTGKATASDVDVEVQLVMTDSTLLDGDDHTPGRLISFGPIHAALGRSIVRDAPRVFLRRLYTHPVSKDLIAMDSRRRTFDGELREFLVVRDQVCRTPWCDAPIRHADHVVAVIADGETSAENGQGLCEACNYVKEAADWRCDVVPGDRHVVRITTPTGHIDRSTAPDPLQPHAPPPLDEDVGDCVRFHSGSRTQEDALERLLA